MSYVAFDFDSQYSFDVAEAAVLGHWAGVQLRRHHGLAPEIDWGSNDPVPDLAAINAACAAFVAAGGLASQSNLAERAAAASIITNGEGMGKVIRAVVLLVLDEFNAHAAKINGILDAADAATNLTTFKSAVALIANQPTRTKQQLLTAITDTIDAGSAD